MDSDDYEVIYYPEDDENRVYCNICDELCIKRFYENHLKSQTHILLILVKDNKQIHTSDVISLT